MGINSNLIKERFFGSTTTGEKDKDGTWKVVLDCTEKIVWNDGTTKEETISFMGMDSNFHLAHQTTLRGYLNWMNDFVYGRGSDSLIEGVAFSKLEAGDGNKGGDNKAPGS